ncbi:MAG: hypothetical protein PHD06_02695 [Bacteroidales bacterium]|jgi:hypothetical protein|nr:hypothetical protein [Bacteroidales bacterium]MDY0198169.1 hypothetical protein [Tenuifilaceae bacterium]
MIFLTGFIPNFNRKMSNAAFIITVGKGIRIPIENLDILLNINTPEKYGRFIIMLSKQFTPKAYTSI